MTWAHIGSSVAACAVGVACGAAGDFVCAQDDACRGDVGPGMCQPDGYCSFPAEDCESGQRYGAHSGARANMCVEPSADTESSAGEGGTAIAGSGTAASAGSEDTLALGSSGAGDAAGSSSGIVPGATGTTGATIGDASEGSSGGPSVDPDLVLWLELEDPGGPSIADASTFGNDGACEIPACPTGVNGVLGGAASFDGTDDAIVVPHDASFETLTGFTIAAWLRIDAQPVGHAAILTKPEGTSFHNSWELYFFPEPEGPKLHFSMVRSDGTSETDASVFGPFPRTRWFHVAGRWDGAESVLFVGGQPVASVANTEVVIDDHPVILGADDDNVAGLEALFHGDLDDARVYRRALTDAEVAELAGGRP